MTSPGATASASVNLRPARDGRLLPYVVIGLGGAVAALVVGQPAYAALATPFLLALLLGLRRTGPVPVTVRITLEDEQVIVGDRVAGRLELGWRGAFDAEVMLHRLTGVAPEAEEKPTWSVPSAEAPLELPFELRATRWGLHPVAECWLRLDLPYGLLSWTGKLLTGPTLRVLPESERLDRLLDPAESRAVLGVHASPRVGDGSEFAQLGPYRSGDRLRDLNWAATARHGRPFVNRYHPERSGDVVIALDVFGDPSTGSTEALRRAARAAWSLASIHLAAHDRVGLVGLGGRTHWLRPASGRLARYRLLELLLRIGSEALHSTAGGAPRAWPLIPASALMVAITPLHAERTVTALKAWRARGRSVAVITIDATDFLPEPATAAEAEALRLWRILVEGRRREIGRLGIPLVTAPAGGDGRIKPLVTALWRAREAPRVLRAR